MSVGQRQLPYKPIAGVVPCPAGWAVMSGKLLGATALVEDAFTLPTIVEVIDYRPSFAVIAIDCAVGLPDEPAAPGRTCDQQVQEIVGWPQRGAVPPAPSRTAVRAPSLEAARRVEPWLTPLAFRRFRWIRELDDELQPYHQRRLYSANPELTFWMLNGEQPLRTSHWWPEGVDERLALLGSRLPGVEEAMRRPVTGATTAHLIDAAGLLWTARRIAGRVVTRVPQDPEWDGKGLRMELVR